MVLWCRSLLEHTDSGSSWCDNTDLIRVLCPPVGCAQRRSFASSISPAWLVHTHMNDVFYSSVELGRRLRARVGGDSSQDAALVSSNNLWEGRWLNPLTLLLLLSQEISFLELMLLQQHSNCPMLTISSRIFCFSVSESLVSWAQWRKRRGANEQSHYLSNPQVILLTNDVY